MKYTFLLAITMLFSATAFSQKSKTIEGVVYYQDTKEPVPFAYVKLTGIAYGTVTEYNGTFSLKIPERHFDKTLEFSYVGLKTQELAINEYTEPVNIYMEQDITELYTVVVNAKRDLNPKSILKKALKAVDENYVNQDFNLNGFYREYIEENNAPVKYADASFILDLKPYVGKEAKNKEYASPLSNTGVITVGSWASRSSSLHRWHFHQKVLKGERAKIIESKASDDLNTTRLFANIQGGPLSALTKDIIKYPQNFLTKYSKYDYSLLEVERNGEGYFLISFEPSMSSEKMGEMKRPFNYEYKLGGTIFIKKDDLAITEINYSVPPEYKQHICGYRGWSVRHFDYSVNAKYEKQNGKYALTYLKHSDEFIVEDTATDRRVPYAAVSEFFTHKINTADLQKITKEENFSNSDYSALFDHSDGYNKPYWEAYESAHPEAIVPAAIHSTLSASRPLEVQFATKLVRDSTIIPPTALIKPNVYKKYGEFIIDHYAWLKDTKNPLGNDEVMDYLTKENEYTSNYFKPLKPLQKSILQEIRAYIEEDYESLPVEKDGYKYYYKYERDGEYPVYFRRRIKENAEEELLFDVNKMAEDHAFYQLGGVEASPNAEIVAYYENTTGNDKWVLKFKDLTINDTPAYQVDYVGGMVWLTNSKILYSRLDSKTFRSSKIYEFDIESGKQQLIYEEKDNTFSVGLNKSRSKEFVFITSASSSQVETQFKRIGSSEKFRVIAPRRENHRYGVTHFEDKFYILTNDEAMNNRLMIADTSKYQEKYWIEEIPRDPEIELLSVTPFKNWMVFQERHQLEYKIKVVNKLDGKSHYINQKDNRVISIGANDDFDTDTLRINYVNFHRPTLIKNYHMQTKKARLLKRVGEPSLVNYANIETVYATAKDGTMIPVTLIYNKYVIKNLKKQGIDPTLYITGYGAYGSSYTPGYNPNISQLILKGIVYAIAHVRGGADLGDQWYQNGKLLNKKNTFTDFIDCTEFLISEGYGIKGEVIAEGGSAGGLLMGAVANMRPDLYHLMILDVPFVDVINTMLDDQLPLTSMEYEEWGDPNEKKYFKYIHSYSPYENVKEAIYPNMLFLTGINDSRVGYWEPAKMVARLRRMNKGDNKIFLKTDFSSGHGGASGRYASLAETAFKYALILEMIENKKAP